MIIQFMFLYDQVLMLWIILFIQLILHLCLKIM